MPRVTLTSAASDDAIAASASRLYLEFELAPGAMQTQVRFSFGSSYTEADSVTLSPGDVRIYEGAMAQRAVSFSAGSGSIIEYISLT